VLGAQPMLGRTFLSDENQAGHDHVVVLGYEMWQRRFASDSKIVGQTIRLDANISMKWLALCLMISTSLSLAITDQWTCGFPLF